MDASPPKVHPALFSGKQSMQWSVEQDRALKEISSWFRNGETQVFHLFGYAGTGKTTLAKEIASSISGRVIFCAFTGKAAYVLKTKGCDDAMTIHSLIYHSRDKGRAHLQDMELQLQNLLAELEELKVDPDTHKNVLDLRKMIEKEREDLKQPYFVRNPDSEIRDASLVIVDECSMIDPRMGEDLLSFGIKILVLGDPAQLPPVGGAGFFTKDVTPDFMLTEIHRQAKNSPILRLATDVRNGIKPRVGSYGEGCEVIAKAKLEEEQVLSFDQILVGRNKTRFATNKRSRQIRGIEDPYPVPSDRLVCLRNHHEEGLLNGAIFNVIQNEGVMDQKVLMEIKGEDSDIVQSVIAHEQHFLGKPDDLAWYEKNEAEEFDYGYALTVHKSQGSQWDSVLLMNEAWCFRQDKWKWLYTGITRAAKKITVMEF